VAARARVNKRDHALDQQDYSTIGLLPGESPVAFEELRKNLMIEFTPDGPLEADHVSTLARLLWRKQNLSTFRRAVWAREQRNRMIREETARRNIKDPMSLILQEAVMAREAYDAACQEATRAADEEARNELGKDFELIQDDLVTSGRLMAELDVEERLDAAIDQCLKRLRALKNLKRNR
jgi:hypothetical protein